MWAGYLRTQTKISTAFTDALADYQKTVKTRRANKHTHKRNFVSVWIDLLNNKKLISS
jgi:hypothetical protein